MFSFLINKILFKILFFRWPSNDFLIRYLPSRHQWAILDQYCGKLNWFKELNSSRFDLFENFVKHDLKEVLKCIRVKI